MAGPAANSYTAHCLATDYSTAVYAFPTCDGPQRWQFQYLDAYPGWAVIWNQATRRCLTTSNNRVVSAIACDGSLAEFRWRWNTSNLQNAGTSSYLINGPGTTAVTLGSYSTYRGAWTMLGPSA